MAAVIKLGWKPEEAQDHLKVAATPSQVYNLANTYFTNCLGSVTMSLEFQSY